MEYLTLNSKEKALFDWVKIKHGDQVRKYTGDPYWTHLLEVATVVEDNDTDRLLVAVSLCHDLIEDTDCTHEELRLKLIEIGWINYDAEVIAHHVQELTDVYVKEDYPKLNRKSRKYLEAERLSKISAQAQTVKYGDFISNTSSIAEHDEKFAKVYLEEKRNILSKMNGGNPALYKLAVDTLLRSKAK